MRVFYYPRVFLIARPALDLQGIEELLKEYDMKPEDWLRGADDSDAEGLVEVMGRLCYGSFGDRQGRIGAESYLRNIIQSGHGSVLEHANWSFFVAGASRGYAMQQVRHRAGFAYSQESTHFIRYEEGPSDKRSQEPGACLTGLEPSQAIVAYDSMKQALAAYELLWESIRTTFKEDAKVKKIVSGQARGVLPNGLESRIGITANARAFRHFCEMRGNRENCLEIRLVACQIFNILNAEAPAIFQGMRSEWGSDEYPIVVSKRHKV